MFDVISSDNGSSGSSILFWYIHQPLSITGVVDFESFGISLHDEQVLQLVQVVHVLDLSVMLAVPDLSVQLIRLDRINDHSVLAHHSKFYDIVGELHPLEMLVIVDINLSEQLNQVAHQTNSVFGFWQVTEHNLDEVVQCETILSVAVVQYLIVIVNQFQLAVVQVVHDIVFFVIVRGLVQRHCS